MTEEAINKVRVVLKELNKAVSPTGSRVEILLDRLATVLTPLAKNPPEGADLEEVLSCLDVDHGVLEKLEEIYEELRGVLESRGYGDEDDDDDEGILEFLLEEFSECLSAQLDDWREECE